MEIYFAAQGAGQKESAYKHLAIPTPQHKKENC